MSLNGPPFDLTGALNVRIIQQSRPPVTIGKNRLELTQLANAALRGEPGCETAAVPAVDALPDVRVGRNWQIPKVVLGDSLISDIDRAVITVHHQLGRQFHLVKENDS